MAIFLNHIRVLFAIYLCFCFVSEANATHIIGGQITYECIGNDTFRMNMKIYRDCSAGVTGQLDGTPGAPDATITVYQGNSQTPLLTRVLEPPIVTEVDPNPNNPCIIVPPGVCLQEGFYVWDLILPPSADTYHVTYQRCCRNGTINNIEDPIANGSTYTIGITNTAQVECNNSPVFVNLPPAVVCVNEDLIFDHSATDEEGDQLVYSLCSPFYGGGNAFGTGPNAATPDPDLPPPYDFVEFSLPDFSFDEPLGQTSPISIDPNTGLLTGLPATQGQYVVGICVDEYRNGELLSSVYRDFQFNVTTCEQTVYAEIGASANNGEDQIFVFNVCNDTIVDFVNDSQDEDFINAYSWEFYINESDTIWSFDKDATIVFPGAGFYEGKMIVNPNLDCTDTAKVFVNISPDIVGDFSFDYDTCVAGPVEFFDLTDPFPSVLKEWAWDFGDNNISAEQNPIHMYENAGEYDLELIVTDTVGCKDTIYNTVNWFPVPPLIIIDPSNVVGCPPVDVFYENLSNPVDTTYSIVWDFGDGNMGEGVSPTHIYEEAGIYTIGIQITSPIGCYTEDTFVDLIEIDSQVVANFTYGPDSITNLQPIVQFQDLSNHVANWQWSIDAFNYYDQMQNPTVVFPDTGQYEVQLVATHLWGCTDTLTQIVDVRPEIKYFLPNAFSPNGDGTNESFGGIGVFSGIENYNMSILNRWGELVFESSNPEDTWNGRRFNTGKLSQRGVYVYTISFKGPRGKAHSYNGFVTLIK